ncbi:MAG: DUF5522 domain-containing protein [Salibacteraceae bacterium]
MAGFNAKKDLAPEDYYMHPDGFIIFTEKYHLKRGYCCQSGCMHCPYGFNKKKKGNDDVQRRNKTGNS